MMSKIRVHNTFINLSEEHEFNGKTIYKSLSMPYVNFEEWYIYNPPSFEEREKCRNTLASEEHPFFNFLLKPGFMFTYNQQVDSSESANSNECIPLDDNGNLTSIGSVRHRLGDCKPCAFIRHPTKSCMNGLRCGFCHFAHPSKRRSRSRKRN